MTVEAVLKNAEELTLEERAELIRRLERGLIDAGWESVPELSDEMKALLDERVAEADANPDAGIPWEVVKAASLGRTRK